MGLQEIQNERFENSEYWPKQDSEVLKYTGQSVQVRVKGRRQGIVCGPDEVHLVTTARGEPLVGTPTGGR